MRAGPHLRGARVQGVLAKRRLFLLAGYLCVGLGFMGYALPVMPGTVFMIIALYCFSRSSERMENWMLNHPWFGHRLRRWKETGAIPMRIKVLAVTCILAGSIGSLFFVRGAYVPFIAAPLAAVGCWYILSRPTDQIGTTA